MERTSGELFLIVGLGNPGAQYRDTRHNIGFMVVDLWSRRLGVHVTGRRFQSRHGRTIFEDRDLILLCPLTFMNQSGRSVKACRETYGIAMERILVIHDDLDMPLGRIKVVRKGGSGGHKGILSITEHLGSVQFPRIKIGIGRPRYNEEIEDFVLSRFYPDERECVEKVLDAAMAGCERFVIEGLQSAMDLINHQNFSMKEEANQCRD